MSDKPNFSTPISRKISCLGLRRTIRKTPSTPVPQSDRKVDYRSLAAPSPTTPVESSSSLLSTPIAKDQPSTSSQSTNCRTYRLSLSKRFRYNKKKKLEFSTSQETEASVDTNESQKPKDRLQEMTDEELIEQIKDKESELKELREHHEKVAQLKATIEIWREGFRKAVEELSSKTEPKMKTEQLLEQLRVPQEMMKYL